VSSAALEASAAGPPPRWAGLAKGIAVLVGLLIIAPMLLRPIVDDPPQKGPDGSSFGTVGGGVAAVADLAQKFGYPYSRRLTPLDQAGQFDKHPLDPTATLVVLDTSISDDAAQDVAEFVRSGGQLVASIDSVSHWTSVMSDAATSFVRTPTDGKPVEAVASVATNPALTQLKVLGSTSFDPVSTIDATQLASRNGLPIVLSVPVGDGSIVALADSSMLTNRLLGEADNAAFALELMGNGTRPIVFAEEPHGFGAALSPSGLPTNVRWFLFGLFVAAILLMITRSKRNGPPELAHRELAPARSTYLLSLASAIDRSNRGPGRNQNKSASRNRSPITAPDPAPNQKPTEN
jgi:hypothetical protein